ncbi:unnamed protein product [Pleuronectes platessa]|uniref:VWFD domain-containing protein n=1 Tax=Pleuronectes platessa TaxID=8262 RepID=A0A9N7VD64_PLEPL|nr:unnamed protein product [Pleuronectes platessa]
MPLPNTLPRISISPSCHLPSLLSWSTTAMEITNILMCLAATLLAVCHGCSTGKEFITTFFPNYLREWKHELHVVVTTQGSEANVHIQVASVGFSKRLTLPASTSLWVPLPIGSKLQKQFHNENSAVRISSSAEISVVSFNHGDYTGDSTMVSPREELGTNYFVFTPSAKSPVGMDKLLAIVNGDSHNQITIIPGGDVKFRDKTNWRKKKAVTITLKPYASYLVQSGRSLTGTQIQSQQPVAVLAGHQCLTMSQRCDHVYEQLPPVASLGKEYVVPVSNSKAKNLAVIVAAEDNTEVTVQGRQHFTKKLRKLRNAGDVTLEKFTSEHPLSVKSDKKVMVLLLSDNVPSDPLLIRLIPTHRLGTDWAVETEDGIPSTVAIISEREGSGSVKVCVRGRCSSPKWRHFLNHQHWVWSNVDVGDKQSHVTVKGDAQMAVYVYGGKHRRSYGTAGICSEGAPPPTPPKDPCEDVKCRVKERCVNGECVHVSTATCHAVGDPHYLTFDGQRYNFQGTCTYIMAEVTKTAADLVPFTVMTKNDHRGRRTVSFVRTVTVSFHQQTVIIGKHRGRAQVNEELQNLPISLLGGLVTVKQSGIYAVLSTDFGLTVKYDWNMRLYITVPSSYYQHLGGLCGNYNGDRKDDLPEGSSLPAVLKMIQQWKVKDSDKFCQDNCIGSCPHCSTKDQAHYSQNKFCGILNKKTGPFSACHKQVDPNLYLDNCVYDVCVNKGARQVLCDNLKSYTDTCLTEGAQVSPEWRMVAKCPLPCPKGSHYEACGSACPATCVSLNSEEQCKALCVEGCQCNKGLVLSGNRCVPKSSCGCQYQGKYIPSDTTFWGDNTCTTRCKCHNGKAKCTSSTCKKNEACVVKGGVRDCYSTSYETCKATGDPHYRTFDNRRFDFQGTCTYILSQLTKGSDPDLVPFQVLVRNGNRGRNKAVSFTKSVSLHVFGNFNISMSRANPRKILVNSQSVNLPYSMEDGKLSVFRRGYFAIVTTYFGLTLKFNWNSHVSLTLPGSYSAATSGLCGNYNGKGDDDLMKPDGTQAEQMHAFGHSWKIGEDPGCTSDCPDGKCPECEPALLQRYKQGRYCGVIASKKGPFRHCHGKLDPTPFLTDCVFDLCMYQGHASSLCDSLSAFSTACQDAGATVESWRTEQFCPPTCDADSHYETCAPPCQLTCSGLGPPEGCDDSAPCTEGCVCDDGFMLSHDKCVPLAECGCLYEGQYYQSGQVFYPGESCKTRCVCSDSGEVECDPEFQCSVNEKCVVKDGFASCYPKGVGSCSVSGVRTVRSFDGQAYPLWGNCVFKLSEVKETEGGLTTFSVLVEQQTDKGGSVSRSVELKVYNIEITMETGVQWEVKVNDVRVPLPVSLVDGKVRAYQNGISIIIETDFDLKLTYDCMAGVFLQIPSTYHSSPLGLCGNYNGKVSDDLGSAKKKPADMVADWVEMSDQTSCETGCGASSCPGPDDKKVPEAKKACDIIKTEKGPFAGCHSTVTPTPDYDACVREMSTGEGGTHILCRHIQSYVTACQLAGAKISEWRSKDFCSVTCPTRSHYELCSSSCSSTCFSLEQPEPCPVCQEGCQCDEGLMSDGVRCVPVEECGCVVDGLYYQSAISKYQDDCSVLCVCQSGQFSCNSTNCQEGKECRNVNGAIGCYPTDPCAEIKCRVKEHCEVSEGEAGCMPDFKASCSAFGDPHYITFDGWSYSFQGTCTYVLVNTTGLDPSLPEVTVTTKNELRGNSEFSYVRLLTVEMMGHIISIPVNKKGNMLVDGIKTELPVILEGGRLSIIQSGIRGIIQSDIGVEVTFDWSTFIMVSLSSSYYGNVVGLCGNFNGKKDDELTAAGVTAVNVTDWAKKLSVADGDPFCYHYCEGVCPQCSKKDRVRFTGPKYCGILSDKQGPFSGCHSKVPVAEFVSDCLYDVCVNKGRPEVLCNALNGYSTECQEAGASIKQWRELASCSVKCPAHSHYEVCGSACPASCGPQPVVCPAKCVEGCSCDPGYVRSGTKCVVKETGCGCNHRDKYYQPGEVFWADSQCEERCVCDEATQKVQCKKTTCPSGETCGIVEGVQGCYPVSLKTCTAHGDQHFITFDGRTFDFQGNCVFKLARVCGDTKGLQKFEVNLENNNRGRKRASYAKVVTVKVYGVTYKLSHDRPGGVLVDGIEQSLPFSLNQSLIQVYHRYRHAVIETDFLKVSFDFASAVRVELASSYQGATCGLCGNSNNDPADDLMLPSGKMASNANKFGVSQWLADVEGCSLECEDCAYPFAADYEPPSYTSDCKVITAKDGPLADCVGRIDSRQFHDDCIRDMVFNNGKEGSACDIISDYVEECQRKGGSVKPWRTKKLCRMQCPDNSKYSVTAPGCLVSCSSQSSPPKCTAKPSEGCVCNPGFLLSQDLCVPRAKCGCFFDGQYVVSGLTFYADSDCQRQCVCQGGAVTCKNKPCKKKRKCEVRKGVRSCEKDG